MTLKKIIEAKEEEEENNDDGDDDDDDHDEEKDTWFICAISMSFRFWHKY